ncbi:MAG: hypothetical protein ABI268_07850 [Rhodanobacter sp.]
MKIAAIFLRYGWLPLLALTTIAWCSLGWEDSPRIGTGMGSEFSALVHWREDGRDWLVVADGVADEVVVYAAADGRPLHRLKVKGGLQDRDALQQQDGHLFVVRQNGTLNELRLPQLEIAAVESR